MPHGEAALTVSLALAAGVLIQCLARTIKVPSIILLLSTGVALGPAGLGWVVPESLGPALFVIVDFAVALILFEGALNLDITRLRREERIIRRLLIWGSLVTLAGGALAARFWLGWPWSLAVLFGSLVVVTGPTVVGPLVRDLRLKPRLQTILEAEGVLIDPIGALLAVLVLQVVLAADALGAAAEARTLLVRLAVGTGFGLAGGLAIAGFLRLPALVHGLENVVALALVVLVFHLGEHVVTQSGLLAVTIAGLLVGNLKGPVDEDLREFKDQLTVLLIGAIFVLLAADIGPDEMLGLGWAGVGVLATLVLLVRPLGVWLSAAGATVTARERVFIGAVAPRGIVAAAIASLTATALASQGIEGGSDLRALVFLVIAGTVVAAGGLAWPLAAGLGLRLPSRDRVAILGAQGLGLALAGQLKAGGVHVVLVDSDPQRCRQAQEAGFSVVWGDGLQERTLRRLPIELVGTVIGATFNDNLNSQFVRLARQAFGVGRGLVSVDSFEAGRTPEHVVRHGADVLFDGPHDQERWDVRWRQGDVVIEQCEYRPDGDAPPAEGTPPDGRREAFVLLTVLRNGRLAPMALSHRARPGDRAAVALYQPAVEDARGQLAALGWHLVAADPSLLPPDAPLAAPAG